MQDFLFDDFKPSCTRETWILRQELLQRVREFFAKRNVLEVETPVLSRACGTDPNLDYFKTFAKCNASDPERYMMTSPEFHLKRLLAAGFGDVYALARSFRKDESGVRHNTEFTMAEWYRVGMPMERLMQEVEELCSEILGRNICAKCTRWVDAFKNYAGIDPYDTRAQSWKSCCEQHGLPLFDYDEFRVDEWRDYVMALVVEPALGMDGGEFIYDYPPSQAALARTEVGPDGLLCAKRFELYLGGTELCNGYQELTDAVEQERRFAEDQEIRKSLGKETPNEDRRFLAALQHGMPECSGVALGLDRLFALALGKKYIAEVLLFPDEIC